MRAIQDDSHLCNNVVRLCPSAIPLTAYGPMAAAAAAAVVRGKYGDMLTHGVNASRLLALSVYNGQIKEYF